MAASHATLLARNIGTSLASFMLAAALALVAAPAANANGYPRCAPDKFTGGSVSDTSPSPGLGVMTISGDVTVPASAQCDGQLVIAEGTTATLHLDGHLTVYALDAASALDNQGTLTITGNGALELTGRNSAGVDNSGTLTISGAAVTATGGEVGGGYGISNSGTLTIAGGTLTATGTIGHDGIDTTSTLTVSGGAVTATGSTGDTQGRNGINNFGTMNVVGGSLTATGGAGSSRGGDGIRNNNGATLAMTTVPTLHPGSGTTGGSPLMNFSKIVMPVSQSAPYAGFAAGDSQATIDANNDTVTPRVLYFFAAAPALGLRASTHALRTPLLQTPAPPDPTVRDLLDALGAVSAYWPKASSDITFTGWYDDDAGGVAYGNVDTTPISSLGTPTFYAHWSAARGSSESSPSSSTQIQTATATTTSAPTTARTTTATTKTTPQATSAFTPANNVADPYTFTSTAAPPAPALPTTSSANDGSLAQLGLSDSSIQRSGNFTATATGFKPGTVADFYLWSTPIYLGSAIADIHGVAVLHIALKPAYVGEHHVQVVGTGLQGQPRNLAQAITITQPPALAETGLGAAWLLGPALLLLLLGLGLVRFGNHRHPARQH